MSNGRVPKRTFPQTASHPQSLTGQDILKIENAETRRIEIEKIGYETFIAQVGGVIRDRDTDAGGELEGTPQLHCRTASGSIC